MSSIFESKPQTAWRKVREGVVWFFGRIGAGFKKMDMAFRALPRGLRRTIYIVALTLAALLLFIIFGWPRLQQAVSEPEEPPRETVAEAIERIDLNTQGHVTPDMASDLIAHINEQIERSNSEQEISRLYVLKFKVYYNAGLFYDAAIIGNEAVEKAVLEGTDRFTVYAGLVVAYGHIGDKEQRRYFAGRAVGEFENGTVQDMGDMQMYVGIAHGIFE
jgi:hypothetical protein